MTAEDVVITAAGFLHDLKKEYEKTQVTRERIVYRNDQLQQQNDIFLPPQWIGIPDQNSTGSTATVYDVTLILRMKLKSLP